MYRKKCALNCGSVDDKGTQSASNSEQVNTQLTNTPLVGTPHHMDIETQTQLSLVSALMKDQALFPTSIPSVVLFAVVHSGVIIYQGGRPSEVPLTQSFVCSENIVHNQAGLIACPHTLNTRRLCWNLWACNSESANCWRSIDRMAPGMRSVRSSASKFQTDLATMLAQAPCGSEKPYHPHLGFLRWAG